MHDCLPLGEDQIYGHVHLLIFPAFHDGVIIVDILIAFSLVDVRD